MLTVKNLAEKKGGTCMRRLLAVFLCLLLASCGSAAGPAAFAPEEADRLVIYTSHPQSLYAPLVKEFEERTGIWVQVETGGTAELLERLAEEAAEPRCDLFFGGGADSLTARKELFSPYTSPMAEEVAPGFLCEDGSWTPFSALPVVLIYNPVLVRMNPPEDWESLLNPVWHGRIAFASPTVSGASYTALATILQVLGEDALESFYHNLDRQALSDITFVVDEVSAASAVAEGSCPIGITIEPAALAAAQAGQDVRLVYPKEGTSAAPDGMAVVRGGLHADNARRFIDFALGQDVQRYVERECLRRPVRKDLLLAGEEDLLLMDYDLYQAAANREAVLARWRALEDGA